MNASKAITRMPELLTELRAQVASVQRTVEDIAGQWGRLCKLGAARDDHAAQLLQSLYEGIRLVEREAGEAKDRLGMVISDPFGD